MKKETNEYKKFKKSKNKYTRHQIAKGVGLGISLAGFGASMQGAFNNPDLSNISAFAENVGLKALDFYRELIQKCNPGNNIPAYMFLGLAGSFIIFMVRGKILKGRLANKTVSKLSSDIEKLTEDNETLSENNEALQETLTSIRRSATNTQA